MLKNPFNLLLNMKFLFFSFLLIANQVFGQFQIQNSGTTASFRGVAAVNEQICWVSGSKGTVLRTIDGGKSWQNLPVLDAQDLDFRDIEAWDDQNAVIMSAGEAEKGAAKIYKTTDGGQHWQLVYESKQKGVFLDGIAFWNRKNGLAFSDPIAGKLLVLLTKDQGNSWQEISRDALPMMNNGEAAFAASGTSIMVQGSKKAWICTGGSQQARVIFTENQGKTWQVSTTPIQAGPSTGLFGIRFTDANKGMAVGGDYAEVTKNINNVIVTKDGGTTWTLATNTNPVGLKEAVGLIGHKWIAVGPSGASFSNDFGQTWQLIDQSPYHAISCAGKTCWAVGGKGTVAKWVE
jgi:photosystem II stability/assembly factor-like uncharacterized protein